MARGIIRRLIGFALALLPFMNVCASADMVTMFTIIEAPRELNVYFLDIGRNDGILLECEGEYAFIDGGKARYGSTAVAYMHAMGITTLKYYIGTHGHGDHIGCAPLMLTEFQVDTVIVPHDRVIDAMRANASCIAQRAALDAAQIQIVGRGDVLSLGGATLHCLAPDHIVNVLPSDGLENENSLVFRLVYGDVSFLLASDTTNTILANLEAQSPGILRSTVYKNIHHGNITFDTVLAAIQPEVTVISTSDDDLPMPYFVNILRDLGSRVYITSPKNASTVHIATDGYQWNVTTANSLWRVDIAGDHLIHVPVGRSFTLNGYAYPVGGMDTLYWTSDCPSVATVSHRGCVTAVSPGQTVIRARGYDNTEAQVTIIVS